jgi:tetratricopeptide (TPR) repeat protein
VCLALVCATVLAYAPVLGRDTEFINADDSEYVVANPHVLTGLSRANLAWAFATFEAHNWHPLTWLSLQVDSQFQGTRPESYHRTNVVLHGLAAAVLFLALTGLTGATWPSAIVAALFALHPAHVESVAWISERKDVLSGLLFALLLGCYAGYARRPGPFRYFATLLVFALGLMAKPMLVTAPIVLLLLDFWPLGRLSISPTPGESPARATVSFGRAVLEKVPFLALAAASSALTVQAQQNVLKQLEQFPPRERLSNAVVAFVQYLGMAFWPARLAAFYPHPHAGLADWQVAGALLLLVAASAWVIHQARRRPYLFVGWFWYLATLLPVIGIVQVGMQARADRYTYIPLIGLTIAAVWGCADAAIRWRISTSAVIVACGSLLAVCAGLTWQQSRHWKNSIALWEHAVEVTPANSTAYHLLADAQARRGELDHAAANFRKAIALDPGDWFAHAGLGLVLRDQHNAADAVRELSQAVKIEPRYGDAYFHLGLIHMAEGDTDAAIADFRRAVDLEPLDHDARAELGKALLLKGEPAEAARHLGVAAEAPPASADTFHALGSALETLGDLPASAAACRRAVALDPISARYRCRLALVLAEMGSKQEAAAEFREAFRLDPSWPEGANQAARRLIRNPDPHLRHGAFALQLAKEACAGTEYRNPDYLDTLAAAYAEQGDVPQAQATRGLALQLRSGAGPGSPIPPAR